ncbi:hypothetical protein CRENBAI_000543 [Crenichthys baileyi]|uniref:Complement factor H n=1 Tax=Crenichthys baileyi TaxID=28760 RepID=A0AAV9RB17_9TELE
MGAKCEPKSCGHPGDAQFADFRLEIGEDFVFGSHVVYECHRGYHMVSRTNRRRCLAAGWDGNIPVCEATKCPVFHVDNNVQVLGDPEQASSGNVVRFSCKSNDEIVYGLKEIHCKDDGEWSGPVPRCKAIRCSVPQIEHGSVPSGPQEYKEHEVLHFRCDPTYKRAAERLPKCTKFAGNADWSPTPACELIKCHLALLTLTGTTYDPPNKNMFSPGETLRVTCGEKHWILDTQTRWTEVTCSDNGAWNTDPVCQEVTCPPYIQEEHYTVNTWGRKTLGDTASYSCDYNYQATRADWIATCTRDGWGPKPLCQGERSCEKPDFRNGFTVSVSEDTLYYSCNENYNLPTKSWWGEAKCKDGVWDELPPCIAKHMCGEAPVISNGRVIVEKRSVKIECNEGYTGETNALTCQNGKWSFDGVTAETICRATAEQCSPPPRVENAIVTVSYQKKYLADSSVTYQCREKYIIEEEATITCQAGKWEMKNIKCIPFCERLSDSRLTVAPDMDKERYMEGDVITYVCTAPGANAEGNATCENGKWTKTAKCPGIPCKVPELGRGLEFLGVRPKNNKVNPGAKLLFSCEDEYDLEGSEEILCLETGNWDAPLPACSEKCSLPDPLPNNVLITSSIQINAIRKGDQISFACKSSHLMKGSAQITCSENGEWSDPLPKCEEKCSLPDPLPNNVLITSSIQINAIRKGDQISFACKSSHLKGSATIICLENGAWSDPLPKCEGASGCSAPPALADGDTKSFTRSDSQYRHGEKVEYVCQANYIMDGSPFKTCDNGIWTGEMRCLKPCTVNEQLMRSNNIQFAYGGKKKLYAPHMDHITFSCKQGTRHNGSVPLRVQCNDGVMTLPTCQ